MVVAIILDFANKVQNLEREGLFVHCRYLVSALLRRYPDFKVEFWTFSFNRCEVAKAFAEPLSEFPGRASLFDETVCGKNEGLKVYHVPLRRMIKGRVHGLLYFLFRKEHNFISAKRNLTERFLPAIPRFERALSRAFRANSTATIIYLPGAIFGLAKRMKLPKVIAVHDLFTLTHRELFSGESGRINEHNRIITGNLNSYSRQGGIFVSSTSYIAEQHVLKFVEGVKREQCEVIPFPPMIKRLTEKENRGNPQERGAALGLPHEYIFYPSQIRPNKNFKLLVQAVDCLRSENELNLPIVTTGRVHDSPWVNSYLREREPGELVVEVGPLADDELFWCYRNAAMVVVPTIIEGMGISGQCLEALCVGGVPVVHARSDGIVESLASVGLSMEEADLNWFKYDDYRDCARQILDAYMHREATIRKQAGIIAKYMILSWDNVAEKYYSLFLRLGVGSGKVGE